MTRRPSTRPIAILATGLIAALSLQTGTAVATTPGTNGRISYMKRDDAGFWQTWTANPDLTHRHQVTTGDYDNGWATWSPDGTRLAFDSARVAPPDTGLDLKEIFLMRPDGTHVTQVTTIGGYAGQPSWAPDGSLLAFVSDGGDYPRGQGIYVVRPDGTGLRRILPLPMDDPQASWLDAPRISPDGRQVAYTYYRGGTDTPHKFAGEVSAVYVADIDGGNPHRVVAWGTNSGDADWSPDGSRLTFETTGTHLGNFASVMVVDADGGGLRALTSDRFVGLGTFHGKGGSEALDIRSSYDPVWSPDGTTILFTHGSWGPDGGDDGLQRIAPDGTGQAYASEPHVDGHQADWGTAPAE
jgi:Tol biopolymer transport system component